MIALTSVEEYIHTETMETRPHLKAQLHIERRRELKKSNEWKMSESPIPI